MAECLDPEVEEFLAQWYRVDGVAEVVPVASTVRAGLVVVPGANGSGRHRLLRGGCACSMR